MSFRTAAKLNTSRNDVIRDLADRDSMHKRLMSLYPDGLGANPRQAINLLFTADATNGEILFQSDIRPVLGPLSDARNNYFLHVITKPTEDVDLQFSDGDTVDFRYWMACLQRSSESNKRVGIADDTDIINKAITQLRGSGLLVNEASIIDRQRVCSARRRINYHNAEISGTGMVSDSDALAHSVLSGLGGGRLWGSGFLLVS